MNFCDPLMKILKSDKMKSVPRNGYEINFVICEAHEICQPLSNKGDLAEVGYSFFYSFLTEAGAYPQLVKATNSKLLGTKILEIFDFFEYLT
jgi:hypothetical protein